MSAKKTSHASLSAKWLVSAKSVELAPRLRDCVAYLRGLEQGAREARPAGLENVAQQLLEPALARSKHAAVRCLAAQAAVELLRIYAPDPPYDTEELKVRAPARGRQRRQTSAAPAAARWRQRGRSLRIRRQRAFPSSSAHLLQTIFALVTSVVPWLKKDMADEELYEGAFAVLDSLDAMRSCCLLAELTNNAFAAHASKPEAQLLDLVNALFDMLWWVAWAGGSAGCFWRALIGARLSGASPQLPVPPPFSPLRTAASRRRRRSRSAPCTSSATWWTS